MWEEEQAVTSVSEGTKGLSQDSRGVLGVFSWAKEAVVV
jgi:hypothetical protein